MMTFVKNVMMCAAMVGALGLVGCGDDDSRPFDGGSDAGPDVPFDVPTFDVPRDTNPGDTGPDVVDPCEGVPADQLCDAMGASCDGDSLVTCAPDVNGCLVNTSTDCGAAGCTDDGDVYAK